MMDSSEKTCNKCLKLNSNREFNSWCIKRCVHAFVSLSSHLQVLCVRMCMFYSTMYLTGWPLSAEAARLRCGSDLLSDLIFVCGDRGIYLGEFVLVFRTCFTQLWNVTLDDLLWSCFFTVSVMMRSRGHQQQYTAEVRGCFKCAA